VTAEQERAAKARRMEEVIRGYFDAGSGLIAEIRAYYASPQATGLDRLELGGYPYAERGYAAT
jgi:hypothetical protein